MKRWIGICLAVLAAIALGVIGTTPPSPLPQNAPATAFSAVRAMSDVRRVASAPHATGTAENAAVRAHLVERLRGMGLETRTAEAALPPGAVQRMARWSKGAHIPATLVNIVAVLPGKDRSLPAVAVMTHHDTVWGSPGAADDTAGIATILETVRAVQAGGQPGRDLVVVITDAEELGLMGAREFFASDPLRQHIGMIINLEARGGGGRTTMFQTSPGNGDAMRLFADHVSRPGASSLAAYVYSVIPNDTDMSISLKGGWPGYNFAFIGRPGLYHSPKATPDRLDQGALQDMGAQVLALTQALLAGDELPERSADVVFFDLFGWLLVVYPPWLGWAMLAASAAGLGWVISKQGGLRAAAAGMARMFALFAGAGIVLFLLNLVSGAGPQANYYDRLAAIPKLEVMAALAGIGAFAMVFGHAAIDKAQQAGAALLFALIGAAAQAAAPTAAYVVVVPVLIVVLAICLTGPGAGAMAKAAALVGAALVLGYMIYLGHFVMQGVGAPMAYVAALPITLAGMALLPVWPGAGKTASRRAGIAMAGLAFVVALWVRLDPVADTIAVYSSDKEVEAIPITKPALK